MRRLAPGRTSALAAVAMLFAACGDADRVPVPEIASSAASAAARSRTEPVGDEATVALAVDRLLAELRELPEGRTADDVAEDLAALGLPGFRRVLEVIDLPVESTREWLLDELIGRLGPASLDVTARAIATPGRLRRAGLAALGLSNELGWPFDERGPAVVRALLAALDDPDVEARRVVLPWLGSAGPTGVPVAETLVAHLEKEEGGWALDALSFLGPAGSSAIPSFLDGIRKRDPEHRSGHFDVLASMNGGSPADVATTLELLNDDDPDLRAGIARAVGRWYDAADVVVPRLVAMLHDRDRDVAAAARAGLASLTRHNSTAKLLQGRMFDLPPSDAARVVALAYGDDDASLAAAAPRLLAIADVSLRTATLRILNNERNVAVESSVLLPLLDDEFSAVRIEAALLLYRTDADGRARTVATATALAADSDCDVRESAARVLAAAANADSVPPALIPLLADPDDGVRFAALSVLDGSSEPLGAVPPQVRSAIIADALRGLPEAASVATRIEGGAEALVSAAAAQLESPDMQHVRDALNALAAAGEGARAAAPLIAPLFKQPDVEREARAAYLAITGDVSVLDWDFSLDEAGARRLLTLGDSGADAIIRWSARVAPWARAKMCADLGEDETLARAVVRAAATPGHDEEAMRLRAGAAGLAPVLGRQRAVGLVVGLAPDLSYVVRFPVAHTLAQLGDAGADLAPATESLRAMLRDHYDDLRRDAILAARRLPNLRADLRRLLTDAEPVVRLQAAAALLADGPDDSSRRALFEALGHVRDEDADLADADWRLVEEAFANVTVTAGDAPVLAKALRAIDDCSAQGPLLRVLARLGPEAAPALVGVRLALAGELPCQWGAHGPVPNRAEAIAALAAMGPAAAPALPDLRDVAAREPELTVRARSAITAIDRQR